MEERRLAAIMFSDIVGYTALMGKDETDTLNLLRENHSLQKSIIDKYNGIFVKEIGDGLMAYFDNANKAVHCGIEIQNILKEKSAASIRIGIHWAEIIIEDNDIFGDGVNIASRIETLADPGGVYVSETLKNSLKSDGQVETKYLGSAKLKNVHKKTIIYAVQEENLPVPSIKRFNALANPKKKFAILPTSLAFMFIVIIALTVVKYLDKRTKIIKAEATLDQIQDIIDLNWRDYSEAYFLAKEVELTIPKNTRLKNFIKQTSVNINITTDPPGAEVYYKLYNQPDAEWQSLGITPLDSVQVPVSVFRWKIEKEGYETVMAATLTVKFKDMSHGKTEMYIGRDFHRVLDKIGDIPSDMTRVTGGKMPYGNIEDFFIDKYEVTNQKYKMFIDQGGYQNPEYWKDFVSILGDTVNWEEVMKIFVDKSGKPGPSTWENQKYPEGEDNYPVSGISWFEANAYARFIGKSIPTKDHWGLARGEGTMLVAVPQVGGNAIFAPYNNYHGDGPADVGSFSGLTSFGAFDMAGNVREWCWNESVQGRWIRGGAWNDNPYMFGNPSQADPFDRSDKNGFRCALYIHPDSIPATAFAMAEHPLRDRITTLPDPISDDQFETYKAYYEYDRIELQDTMISRTENDKGWILEKVEFNTAYDNERMVSFLFLPTNTKPPYQSVIYGPGSNVFDHESSEDIENFFEFFTFLEFFVKYGRAAIFPIIKGSFERRLGTSINSPPGSYQYTSDITRIVKDYRRCLDYLETRDDFDLDKIAFYGMSAGPTFGAYLTAVDSRIKANIFYAGGLVVWTETRPEVNLAYFVPRIKIPTLMINGRYDALIGPEGIINMYNLLGTPEKNKRLVLLDSDHLAPKEDLVNETLYWLDQQFGKVEYSIEIQRLEEPIALLNY